MNFKISWQTEKSKSVSIRENIEVMLSVFVESWGRKQNNKQIVKPTNRKAVWNSEDGTYSQTYVGRLGRALLLKEKQVDRKLEVRSEPGDDRKGNRKGKRTIRKDEMWAEVKGEC